MIVVLKELCQKMRLKEVQLWVNDSVVDSLMSEKV